MTGGRRNPTRRIASIPFAAAIFTALMLPQPALAQACHASANCHIFSFAPATYEVNEGAGKVTITVRRAGEFAPSSVRVRTVNGTAAAGQDYTAVDTRVSWDAEGGPQRTIDVRIMDDGMVEGNEQFTVELSDGQGSPGFALIYGNPATVTIIDNNQAASAPPSQVAGPPPPAVTEPEPSPTEPPAPGGTLPGDSTPGEGSEIDDDGEGTGTVDVAADEDDDGASAVPTIVAIALIVAGGAGGGLWWLRRRQATA